MKLFWAFAFLAASLIAAVNPQLKQVNAVYILGMSSGMDQFLANQFTTMSVFQVVTDPQKADAIVTDRLGEPFESKLKELYPRDSPAVVAAEEKKNNADISGAARVSSIGRGRGTFFIVDRKSHNVLWSIYEEPKDSTPTQLTKTARKIVQRLKNDLTDKKQNSE
jgi:hypothetical protein